MAAGLAWSSAARASEADLVVPDLSRQRFFGGAISGAGLLDLGFLVAGLGLVFGLVQFVQLRKLPVHKAMLEISELIYETCKTYLVTVGPKVNKAGQATGWTEVTACILIPPKKA